MRNDSLAWREIRKTGDVHSNTGFEHRRRYLRCLWRPVYVKERYQVSRTPPTVVRTRQDRTPQTADPPPKVLSKLRNRQYIRWRFSGGERTIAILPILNRRRLFPCGVFTWNTPMVKFKIWDWRSMFLTMYLNFYLLLLNRATVFRISRRVESPRPCFARGLVFGSISAGRSPPETIARPSQRRGNAKRQENSMCKKDFCSQIIHTFKCPVFLYIFLAISDKMWYANSHL